MKKNQVLFSFVIALAVLTEEELIGKLEFVHQKFTEATPPMFENNAQRGEKVKEYIGYLTEAESYNTDLITNHKDQGHYDSFLLAFVSYLNCILAPYPKQQQQWSTGTMEIYKRLAKRLFTIIGEDNHHIDENGNQITDADINTKYLLIGNNFQDADIFNRVERVADMYIKWSTSYDRDAQKFRNIVLLFQLSFAACAQKKINEAKKHENKELDQILKSIVQKDLKSGKLAIDQLISDLTDIVNGDLRLKEDIDIVEVFEELYKMYLRFPENIHPGASPIYDNPIKLHSFLRMIKEKERKDRFTTFMKKKLKLSDWLRAAHIKINRAPKEIEIALKELDTPFLSPTEKARHLRSMYHYLNDCVADYDTIIQTSSRLVKIKISGFYWSYMLLIPNLISCLLQKYPDLYIYYGQSDMRGRYIKIGFRIFGSANKRHYLISNAEEVSAGKVIGASNNAIGSILGETFNASSAVMEFVVLCNVVCMTSAFNNCENPDATKKAAMEVVKEREKTYSIAFLARKFCEIVLKVECKEGDKEEKGLCKVVMALKTMSYRFPGIGEHQNINAKIEIDDFYDDLPEEDYLRTILDISDYDSSDDSGDDGNKRRKRGASSEERDGLKRVNTGDLSRRNTRDLNTQ